jgi:hypothetical protein
VSIVDIWVDSPASRDGGRELWGIPKELADLDFHTREQRAVDTRASSADAAITQARISVGAHLPWRWPTRFSVTQVLNGRIKTTPVRARAGVRLAKARWEVAPDGPLAYLSGRRPLFTVALRDFRLVFGQTPAA